MTMSASPESPIKKSCDERAMELIEYRRIYGDFNVPSKDEYVGLYQWMRRLQWYSKRGQQERNYRQTFELTQERVDELTRLGFSWTTRTYQQRQEKGANEGRWQRRLQDLRDFRQSHGHCNVPSRFPENVRFGNWIKTVRYAFRR